MKHQVFISFRFHPDEEFAQRIALILRDALRDMGVAGDDAVFFASANIRGGQDFIAKYEGAIQNAHVIVLVVSEEVLATFPNAVHTVDHVLHEWELALQQRDLGQAEVVPLLLPKPIIVDGQEASVPFKILQGPQWRQALPTAPHAGGLRVPVATTVEGIFTKLLGVRVHTRRDEVYLRRFIVPEITEALAKSKEAETAAIKMQATVSEMCSDHPEQRLKWICPSHAEMAICADCCNLHHKACPEAVPTDALFEGDRGEALQQRLLQTDVLEAQLRNRLAAADDELNAVSQEACQAERDIDDSCKELIELLQARRNALVSKAAVISEQKTEALKSQRLKLQSAIVDLISSRDAVIRSIGERKAVRVLLEMLHLGEVVQGVGPLNCEPSARRGLEFCSIDGAVSELLKSYGVIRDGYKRKADSVQFEVAWNIGAHDVEPVSQFDTLVQPTVLTAVGTEACIDGLIRRAPCRRDQQTSVAERGSAFGCVLERDPVSVQGSANGPKSSTGSVERHADSVKARFNLPASGSWLLTLTMDGKPFDCPPLRITARASHSTWGGTGSKALQFRDPGRLFFDKSYNTLFVADTDNHRVQAVSIDDAGCPSHLCTIGSQQGAAAGQMNHPSGVCSSSDGIVYVADFTNHRIQAFKHVTGEFLVAWGSQGSDNGEFRHPCDVAAAGGEVFVADRENHRVQAFSSMGDFRRAWPCQMEPRGISAAGDRIYVSGDSNVVLVFDKRGTLLQTWGGEGRQPGQFNNPSGISAVHWPQSTHSDGGHADGIVFVVDQKNSRVQVFGSSGQFCNQILCSKTEHFQGTPRGCAVDGARGVLYVSDSGGFVHAFVLDGECGPCFERLPVVGGMHETCLSNSVTH